MFRRALGVINEEILDNVYKRTMKESLNDHFETPSRKVLYGMLEEINKNMGIIKGILNK